MYLLFINNNNNNIFREYFFCGRYRCRVGNIVVKKSDKYFCFFEVYMWVNK